MISCVFGVYISWKGFRFSRESHAHLGYVSGKGFIGNCMFFWGI